MGSLRHAGQNNGRVEQHQCYYFANAKLRPVTLYGVVVYRERTSRLRLINAYRQLFKIAWLRPRLVARTQTPFKTNIIAESAPCADTPYKNQMFLRWRMSSGYAGNEYEIRLIRFSLAFWFFIRIDELFLSYPTWKVRICNRLQVFRDFQFTATVFKFE